METQNLDLTGIETTYPPLSDRVQSSLIDAIFLVILMYIFSSLLDQFEDAPNWVRIVLFIGIWVAYEPVATSLGCTIGNYVKNIRVRQNTNLSKRINILQALIRYVVKITLGLPSFLTIHLNKERRAIHDLIVGSVMVKK
jgi:uncharacterized RDD family membrane protein YckC